MSSCSESECGINMLVCATVGFVSTTWREMQMAKSCATTCYKIQSISNNH